MADPLELREEIRRAVKADRALAELAARHDLAFQPVVEPDAFAYRQLAARAAPAPASRGRRAETLRSRKTSTAAAQVLAELGIVLADGQRADARAVAEQPRRKHARIVEHQAIAGPQELRKVAERPVLPTALFAVDHQHARGGAVGEGFLRDQFLGQVVIEFGQLHPAFTVAETGPVAPPRPRVRAGIRSRPEASP